jgi:surface protein
MFSTTFINNINFLKDLDTNNVKYMTGMFKDCFYLEDVDITNLNTKNVIDISYMFENCGYLKKINLNNF